MKPLERDELEKALSLAVGLSPEAKERGREAVEYKRVTGELNGDGKAYALTSARKYQKELDESAARVSRVRRETDERVEAGQAEKDLRKRIEDLVEAAALAAPTGITIIALALATLIMRSPVSLLGSIPATAAADA